MSISGEEKVNSMGHIDEYAQKAKRTAQAIKYGFWNSHDAKDLHVRVDACSKCNVSEAIFCEEHKQEIENKASGK